MQNNIYVAATTVWQHGAGTMPRMCVLLVFPGWDAAILSKYTGMALSCVSPSSMASLLCFEMALVSVGLRQPW